MSDSRVITDVVVMEGIDKTFPGRPRAGPGAFRAARRRGACAGGRKRRGQIDADEDAGRRLLQGRGPHRLSRARKSRFPARAAAQNLGISIIHQELNLMPHLTVAQNIFIGREPRAGLPLLARRKGHQRRSAAAVRDDAPEARSADEGRRPHRRQAADGRDRQGALVQLRRPDHGRADRRAHRHRDRRAVPHRPAAARDKGVGIVHISHRLEELKQISDRITVMRDGRDDRHGDHRRTRRSTRSSA